MDKWYIDRPKCCDFGICLNPKGWDKEGHPLNADYSATFFWANGNLTMLGEYIMKTLGTFIYDIPIGGHRRIRPPVLELFE